MSATPLTERLVRCALETVDQPAPATRTAAARTLFDFCACLVSGVRYGMLGWPLDRAGRIAVYAHARDQDDLHLLTSTHPGGVVWSAVTACGLEQDVTVESAFDAATVGYEIVVRLADAAGPEHRQRWHLTTSAGVAGAAGAAALLLGGGVDGVVDAVGHALSVSGGSSQALFERSGTRIFHRAHAASTGVACARAACSGLGASALGLEAGRGAFVITSATAADLLAMRPATAIEETGFRLHAANGFAQAAIDAVLQLGAIEPDRIARVAVTVSPPMAAVLASNQTPTSDEEAWWSIEHAISVCLVNGSPDALESGLSDREDVLGLCGRTTVTAEGVGWAAEVSAILDDGSARTASVVGPHGHEPDAAADDDLCAKWWRLCGADGSSFLERLLCGDSRAGFTSLLRENLRHYAGVTTVLC